MRELEFRSIGLLPVPYGFSRSPVARDFDVILFFDQTAPARPLR
jgi:hypothetical protein